MITNKPTKLTQNAAVRLVLKHVLFTELYYSFNIYEMPAGFNMPFRDTLATDENSMWVSPEFWGTLPLDLQVSAVTHEILHKMLHHCTRRKSRDPLIWQGCCDEVVNEILVDNGMPIAPTWVQPVPARHGWSVDARYAEAVRNLPPPKPTSGGGDSGESGYEHMAGVPQSWKDAWRDIKEVKGTAEEIAKHEEKVEAIVQKAIHMAKAFGALPKGIEMATDLAFKPADEPWYNHLHRFMQSLCVSEYNWRRMNKRYLITHRIFAPDHYAESLGPIIVLRDTSGSCFSALEQARFMSHVHAIMEEAKPSSLLLVDFDTRVHQAKSFDRWEEVELRPKGGGGTSFVQPLKWCEEQDPQPVVVICATDMIGSFPSEEPPFPVIWASTTPGVQGPFGETIHVS